MSNVALGSRKKHILKQPRASPFWQVSRLLGDLRGLRGLKGRPRCLTSLLDPVKKTKTHFEAASRFEGFEGPRCLTSLSDPVKKHASSKPLLASFETRPLPPKLPDIGQYLGRHLQGRSVRPHTADHARTLQIDHWTVCGNRFCVRNGTVQEKKKHQYTCPHCGGLVASNLTTGQIDHRTVCGNLFYVTAGKVKDQKKHAQKTRAQRDRCGPREKGT